MLDHTQIDLMNLGQWVAELDKRIEGILLWRLTHIVRVVCEFDGLMIATLNK